MVKSVYGFSYKYYYFYFTNNQATICVAEWRQVLSEFKFMYELNDFCVMAILCKGASYGYQINQELLEVLDMSESTLYPILKKLEKQGVVESYSSEHGGRLRRYCKLTEHGNITIENAKRQWKALRDWVDTKFEEESKNEQS